MNRACVPPPASDRRTPRAAQITRSLRRFLPALALLVVALGVVGGAWLYADQRAIRHAAAELTARLEVERARREALEREIVESGERVSAYRQDVAPLLASGRDQLDRIERKVRRWRWSRTPASGSSRPMRQVSH